MIPDRNNQTNSPPSQAPGPGETLDALLDGRLFFFQPARGHRFSVDALLLAAFARLSPGQRALDLGAGCGVVGLLLAWANPEVRFVGLELQSALADLARRNVALNHLDDRVSIVQGDLCRPDLFPPHHFDAIVANPPYRPLGAGRLGPDDERNTARHEIACRLEDWTTVAARWLRPGGRLYLVYPVWRLASLLARLGAVGLAAKRLRLVYTRPEGPGRLALVEGRAGGREDLKVSPPFFIHAPSSQEWSQEMSRLASGRFSGAL